MGSGRERENIFEDLFCGCDRLAETHVLERFQVLRVARGTVGHVLPLRIVLDGVIELGGAPGERQNARIVRAPAPLRIRVRIQNALLNLALNAFPLLFRRLFFHPPNIVSVFGRKCQKNLLPAYFLHPSVETTLHRFRLGFPHLDRNLRAVISSTEHLVNKTHLGAVFPLPDGPQPHPT